MITDAVNSVLYNIDQREDTSAADKKTARDNIGAVSADDIGEIMGNYKPLQVPVEITYPDYAILKKLTQNTNGVVGIECSYISCATQSDNGLMSATDKTKLDGIAAGAEVNVQSDWNQSDSDADDFIKNKPSIPAAQVNSDWNASSGVAEILNKPSIPSITTTTEGPDETIVVPVTALDFNLDDLKVKANTSNIGTLAPIMTPTEQRVLTLDAGDSIPYWAVPSAPGTECRLKERVSGGLQYTDLTQLTFGPSNSEVYGLKEGESSVTMIGLIGPYPSSSDDGRVLTARYGANNNSYAEWAAPSCTPELKYLESQTVSVTQSMTLNIADGYAYVLSLSGSGSPTITLATNSTSTLRSLIAVKNAVNTSCNSVTIRYYDETNTYHDVVIQLHETSNEYDFYVDIRKVTIGNNTASIARVYDMPCMWRDGSGGTPRYESNTAWIGLLQ